MSKAFSVLVDGLEISGSSPVWPTWRYFGRYYSSPRSSYVGSLFGCDFVAIDEKEDTMDTLKDVYVAFGKLTDLNKAAGKVFGRLVVYGDGSGHIEDGNDDEVVSWDKNFDGAVAAINQEIENLKPEWTVQSAAFGTSYFLCHERFGLRYPIASGMQASVAESLAKQLYGLANRDMPKGWILPIGTQVIFTDDNGDTHIGIIVMVDESVDIEDDYSGLYLVNFTDPDDDDEDYQARNQEWASSDQVKVDPHDPKMRMSLLQLASSYAMDLNKLGLLI